MSAPHDQPVDSRHADVSEAAPQKEGVGNRAIESTSAARRSARSELIAARRQGFALFGYRLCRAENRMVERASLVAPGGIARVPTLVSAADDRRGASAECQACPQRRVARRSHVIASARGCRASGHASLFSKLGEGSATGTVTPYGARRRRRPRGSAPPDTRQ